MPVSKNIFQKTTKKVRTVLWRLAIKGGVVVFWRRDCGVMAV
jgi:hypothetical protein